MSDYNLGPYRPHPLGEFDPTKEYQYLDIVSYNGSSYINCNVDTIDGVSCIGILPTGQPMSESYWMCLSRPGEKGEVADVYAPYGSLEDDGSWDFSKSDKIFIPEGKSPILDIKNLYNGACGVIITRLELFLPKNSMKSSDFDYIDITSPGEYYFYTFTCTDLGAGLTLIWHRSVVSK